MTAPVFVEHVLIYALDEADQKKQHAARFGERSFGKADGVESAFRSWRNSM